MDNSPVKLDVEDPFSPPRNAAPPAGGVKLDVADPFAQAAPPAPQPVLKRHSTLGDLARGAVGHLEHGAGVLVRGLGDVGERLDSALGIQPMYLPPSTLTRAGQKIEKQGEGIAADVSPEFAQKTSMDITEPGGFTPTNIASKAINSIAEMGAPIVASLVPGVGPAAGVIGFGAQGEAGGREAGEQQVDALTDAQLQGIPRYQELVGQGMAPAAARAQFKQEVANRQGLVGGAFGAGLGVVGKIPGVGALERGATNVLTRAVGKRAGAVAGKSIAEGVGFGGINAAGQVAANVSNQVPTKPTEGAGEAFASGLLPGAVLGFGHGILHREPYPGAAPGSLSDAANTLHESGAVKPPEGTPAGQTEKPVTVKAPPPPAPWINPQTGEARTPDASEVVAALHGLLDQKAAAAQDGRSIMFAPKDVAETWGLPLERVKTLMRVTLNERRSGVTTEQAQQRATEAAAQTAPAEPTVQSVTETVGQQPDLLDQQNLTPRQRARIAQRIRGGGVAPGVLESAAAEATANAPKPEEETPHAEQVQPQPAAASGTPGGTGREGVGETPAAAGEGGRAPAAAAGEAGGAAGTAEADTSGLEHALTKTDRATGPDGATYMVKENANGEGYHVTRSEDGSSTQHRSDNPAKPWTREQAVSAAAQLARERAAPAEAAVPDVEAAQGAATPEQPTPSGTESAPAGRSAGEGPASATQEAPTAENVQETTPKAPEIQPTSTEQESEHATGTREQPEGGQPEHPNGNGGGETAEAGGSDRTAPGPTEPEAPAVPAERAEAVAPAPTTRAELAKQVFDANKAAIKKHGFKAGDRVSYEENGKTVEGTIAKGDRAGIVKDQGIFEIERPGRAGRPTTYMVHAARLTKLEPKPTVEEAARESAAHPKSEREEPSAAQHEAGNFKMGHVDVHGMDVTIEVPKGGVRKGKSASGEEWQRRVADHYGYIKGSTGADGEHVDVYLGPKAQDPDAKVYVIDQVKPGTKAFDEHKAMIGFPSAEGARKRYEANFPRGLRTFGGIREMTVPEFKDWVANGDKSKPVAPQEKPAKVARARKPAETANGLKEGDRVQITKGGFRGQIGELRGVSGPNLRNVVIKEGRKAGVHSIHESALRKVEEKAPETAPPAAPEAGAGTGKIEDFGEKLGGARKDEARSLSRELSDDDIASQPLSKIWPASEIDAIEDPFTAAVAHAARAEIPAKPRTPSRVRRWVAKVQSVRGLARHAQDGTLTPEKLASSSGLLNFAAKVKLLQNIDRSEWSRIGDVREYPDAYAFGPNGEHIPKPSVMVSLDGRWQTFDGAKSIDDAMDAIKARLGTAAPTSKLQFEIRGNKKTGHYFINKKGDGEYRRLKEFTDLAEARAFLKNNHADLVKAWEDVKQRDNVTKADMRNAENRERVGPDYRDGKDVTPEQFGDAFGFRGVEFGNWVKQGGNAKERQGLLNQAFDALHDLANLIGVPPRAMSLDGSLGLGLGSRGHGWASAHFEPDRLVINLTKTRGAGTLAHEWFHALDNYFARSRGAQAFKGNQQAFRRGSYVTYRPEPMMVNKDRQSWRMTRDELASRYAADPYSKTYQPEQWQVDPTHPPGVRPVVEKAFAELVKTLNESPMRKRAETIDKGVVDGYWSRIIERGARSFENYVIARMEEKGITNDYLANVRKLENFARDPARYPYLKPEEVKPVADAFDTLFKTVETRKSENGNVALFSKPEQKLSDFMRGEAVAEAASDALPPVPGERAGIGEITRRVVQYFRDRRITAAENPQIGRIVINPSGVRSSLEHGYGREKIAAFTLVPDVIQRGRVIDERATDQFGNARLTIGAPVRVLGKDYLMGVQVNRNRNGNKTYYLHEVTLTPKEDAGSPQMAEATHDARQAAGQTGVVETLLRNAHAGKMDGAYSTQAGSAPGVPRERVQRIVDQATAAWGPNQPRVHVLDSADQLPREARFDSRYGRAEGYYDGNDVYLVAPNLTDEARVQQVLAHEAVGHYGLDRILGEKGWAQVRDAVAELESEGRGSDKVKAVLAETRRRYPNADPDTFAKEFMAVSAEKGVRTGLLDRVVAAVRAFLRKIMPNLKLREAELRQLLVRSERFLHRGDAQAQPAAHAAGFDKPADTFYSALSESVGRAQGAPRKADATGWKQWLDGAQRRGEFKGAEREWMGVDAWLDSHKGPITREDVQQFARENQVQVREVMHGDEPPSNAANLRENEDGSFDVTDEAGDLATTPERPTKFDNEQLPGGTNYRELLLTLPETQAAVSEANRPRYEQLIALQRDRELRANEREELRQMAPDGNYRSSHFDEPNILAHVRFNDRTGPDGERILHVEEVQSDWHQIGRKRGYNFVRVPTSAEYVDGRWEVQDQRGAFITGVNKDVAATEKDALAEAARRLRESPMRVSHSETVPDAPFKKEWPMLAMKRVLRYAAEHGYDKVTWTTGEQQAERYDLSKQVDAVQVLPGGADAVHVMVKPKGAREFQRIGDVSKVPKEKLADVLGKDLAERALRDTADGKVAEYSGVDLKVGGEGMRGFYDKLLPNELNKYVKRWGAKVGEDKIPVALMSEEDFRQAARNENNPNVATVHSIDITPAMRESVMQGQPLFSRPEAATMDDVDKVMKERATGGDATAFQRLKAALGGKYEDLRPKLLGAIQTRHLIELMRDVPILKGHAEDFQRSVEQLDADRNHLLVGAPDAAEHPDDMLAKGAVPIAQALRDYTYQKGPAGWLGRRRPEAQKLFDLQHKATILGMDPDKEYQRLTIENAHGDAIPWTREAIKQRMKMLRERALGLGGDPQAREGIRDELKYLRALPKMERTREQRWPELVREWQALPDEAKALYRQQRDWYSAHRDATEQALIRNIEAMNMPEVYRRSLVNRMRLRFEEARRSGVYFPLNRDGDYWIAFQDKDGNEGFKMFEKHSDQIAAEKKLRNAGFTINSTGRRDHNLKAAQAPSGTFVREIIDILQKAHVSEKTQDAIYQAFLKSLPEMSMRKHSIHRRNIAGFSEDGLRAFAKNGFHGAYQLARLRHSQDMQTSLDAMQASADAYRKGSGELGSEPTGATAAETAKIDALLGELVKRHEWIMSPSDTQLANMANSIGFVYYLGASPASAMTNLTQVVQTVLPVLGAQHGWPKAMRVLGAAWRDAARTGGHLDRTLTNPDEKRAFLVMQQRGDFSKTQSHTLAGLAEGNVLQTSPGWTKTMNAISWMFHTAEVINREATGMAAFRLARAQGKDFNEAIAYAGEINAGTNFDYSAANRPRLMQNNTARIALQFKQYSLGMTWLFYRNLYKAFKGETPEVRRQARRTVTGILAMTALLAGTTGLPIYNGVKMAANAANLAFGDPDEPFDFDAEFRAWLAEFLGDEAANIIATGPVSEVTGADFARRTSLANLWFQDADRNLEGEDAYHALLESLAGPLGGITKNMYVGAQRIREGNVQRGIETMLPTAAKNAIRALRFAHDGANTLRGDPILPDVSAPQDFVQALGFTPTKLAHQERLNSALVNFTQAVQDRRQTLLNAYAMAVHSADPDDRGAVMDKIRDFNGKYPAIAISPKTIRASMRARARYSARAVSGIAISPKLLPQAREFAGVGQ